MLTIKVLGPRCSNCKRLEQEVHAALEGTAVEYELLKVTDYGDIVAYGIMSTPGLVMNETVVAAGRIPKAEQIRQWAAAQSA